LNDDDLYICSEWMKPFFDVLYFGQNLMSIPVPASRPSAAIPIDEIYSIQIHNISLDFLVNKFSKNMFLYFDLNILGECLQKTSEVYSTNNK
jgi:hypothetical protein